MQYCVILLHLSRDRAVACLPGDGDRETGGRRTDAHGRLTHTCMPSGALGMRYEYSTGTAHVQSTVGGRTRADLGRRPDNLGRRLQTRQTSHVPRRKTSYEYLVSFEE